MPLEQEALDEIVAEQDRVQGYLDLVERLDRIIDHVYAFMVSGLVEQGFEE